MLVSEAAVQLPMSDNWMAQRVVQLWAESEDCLREGCYLLADLKKRDARFYLAVIARRSAGHATPPQQSNVLQWPVIPRPRG